MANWWDQDEKVGGGRGGGDWWAADQVVDAAPAPASGRSAADWARDVGVTALKGAVGLPQAFAGLLNLADTVNRGTAPASLREAMGDPTSRPGVGKALEDAGLRFEDAQKGLDELYSPAQQAANRKVAEADGFLPTVQAALENPSTIARAAVESIPQMLGGAAVGRAVVAGAPKVAPWLAGAIGEGAIGAGSAAEQIRGESKDGELTLGQALAALGSGATTAALGAAGGRVAQKLGLGDVDTMLVAGPTKLKASPLGFAKQVIGSGISEGVFEELPQSITEQMWQNYATGKPVMEGVGNAAAMGMLTGAAMGAAGGGYNAAAGMRGAAAPAPAAPGTPGTPAGTPGTPGTPGTEPIPATEVLGGETETAPRGTPAEPTDAEKALLKPRQLTDLDRVQAIDAELSSAEGKPEVAAALQAERAQLTRNWPQLERGAPAPFTTEAGAKVDSQYALVDIDKLVTSHDEDLKANAAYPQELQPRQRDRAASEMQVQAITQKLDPARLGQSADAATGAPIVGADGLVESGNARTIAMKRVYQADGLTADEYRGWLRANAAQFGLQPEQVDALAKPMLVRVRTTPVDRAEFARQANAPTVAAMSPVEQARSDAARIDVMDDLQPDENGDFATSRDFIRRFVGRLPMTEQAGMLDAGGRLSSAGYSRVRNAVLAKAYGNSPVLTRMVESMNDDMRNVSRALMIAAPRVAQARGAIAEGRRFDADITPHLVAAAEQLASLKERGTSVDDALAQSGLLGEEFTPETRELMRFIAENTRRPRRMAEFITAYFDALDAAGDPAQGSLLGEVEAPRTSALMQAARAAVEGPTNGQAAPEDASRRQPGADRPGAAVQPADAPGNRRGDQGAGAPAAEVDWVDFPEATGTLGIPRAEMPQIPGKDRGALVAFLEARGIPYARTEVAPDSLRPTQREFSRKKTQQARQDTGGAKTVIVSGDGYVLDGHHRWMAQLVDDKPVDVMRFKAPIRELLAAVREFPGTKSSAPPSTPARDAKAQALADFQDALADLAMLASRYTRAALIPAREPELMPTLRRLAGAAIKIVGTDLRRVTRWVVEALRRDPTTRPYASKVTPQQIRKAAEEALGEMGNDAPQRGLFDEAELPGLIVSNSEPMYRAYPLTPADRQALLKRFPPTHPRVIADHLSAQSLEHMDKVKEGPAKGEVVGVMDADGLQALIVSLNGNTETAGGDLFHISWSAEPGFKTRFAGATIARNGYTKLDRPIPLDLSSGPTIKEPMRGGDRRQPGETDKQYAKRVVDKRPAPSALPEQHERYFLMDGSKVVPIADIISTKSAEENAQGGENGAKRMEAAARGELSRRGPITVMPSEAQPGKFEVVDGNGTLTSVSKYGWKSLPVTVVTREVGLAQIAADRAKDAAKASPQGASIGGQPYDLERDNYRPPRPPDFMTREQLAAADDFIQRFFKEKAPYEMDPAVRAEGERLLQPFLDRAAKNQAAYNQKIIDIAQRVGALGQMLAPLKGAKRAVEKMHQDMIADKLPAMDPSGLKDLLRSTIVVSHYADAQAVVDEIGREFKIVRIKNRTESPLGDVKTEGREKTGGYADVLVNVAMPDGMVAEIQINVPEMLSIKQHQGHKLYEAARDLPADDKLVPEIYGAMRQIYDDAFAAANRRQPSALLRKAASEMGAQPERGKAEGRMALPESSSLNTEPSGISAKSSPSNDAQKREPSGNLSGIGTTATSIIVPEGGANGRAGRYNEADGQPGQDLRGGAEGEGAGAARQPEGRGEAGAARPGAGGSDVGGDRDAGAGAAPGAGVGSAGPGGVRGQDANGRRTRARGRAGRGAGVPAARDIKPKTGRNFRFSDEDLTYSGSWFKKAERNVEAIELLKRLEKEGRQATRDEQRTLAQFIGWGASEIANGLFNPLWNKSAAAIDAYEAAKAAVKDGQLTSSAGAYWGAITRIGAGGGIGSGIRYGAPIPADRITPEVFGIKGLDLRYRALRERLKDAMTAEEWAAAERTTQYAHFTSAPIVRSMWAAMRRFGFEGGAVLEPGAGNGIFPGLIPEELATNTAYTGIEYDPITGGILKQLQPDEHILVESYIDTKLPPNFYDVAIGNPPFQQKGAGVLADPEYRKHAFALHDYFFAKTLDRVRPGGIVAFVTSRYTMDKAGDKARQFMAERADLVGAIRLPQTAFKQNAGTQVVTDVLFLRKKVPGETFEQAQPWQGLAEVQTKDGPAMVNEYFAAHPEMVLGTHALVRGMHKENEYSVLPLEGSIEEQFAAAVERLPAGIYHPARGSAGEAAKVRDIDLNPKAQKEGNYYLTDAGVLMQRENGVGMRVDMAPKDAAIVKAFVPLRDALKQAQFDQLNDGAWESSLAALRQEYEKFVAAHGQVNQFVTRTVKVKVDELDDEGTPTGRRIDDEEERRVLPLLNLLRDDPDYTLVAALEKVDEDTGAITASSFLGGRVLGKPEAPQILTPHDALLRSLNDLGRVDVESIATALDVEPEEAVELLGTAIYEDPSEGWQTADQYLSGNVKRKLRDARVAARADKRFERNVSALEAAQPAPKNQAQIDAGLGVSWIPGSDYEQFLQETTGVRATVKWNTATRQWAVTINGGHKTTRAVDDWGTASRHAGEILEHALTGRPIKITKTVLLADGREQSRLNESATEAANEKLAKMREAFQQWIWKDEERASRLVAEYNDRFNTTVPRAFDGRHLTLPGTSKQFHIFDHVKRGAWRIIQSGNTYLAHAVGSGKTFQMVIAAMEQKRLGLVKKPMIVVPNHMLQQFAREWQELYPAARLMIADEQNFHTENRRRFVSRVALSDLDGVIITHSAFKLLDLDPAFKGKIIEEQLQYLRASLEEAEDADGKRSPRVKQIQRQIENLEQKLKAAMSGAGKDRNVRFDELGVDQLFVDEAHTYRKLDFATARQVKGIQPEGSAQALDLYIKSRYLEEKHPGRSLVMASGTVITNTLAEMYTVQRFLGAKALEEAGIDDFDSWAAAFGREATALEPNAAGKYEPVTRFKKFVNVGELVQMFRQFADVVTSDQLAALLGDKRPKVAGGSRSIIVTPKTEAYAAFQKVLAARYEASKKWRPSEGEPHNPDPAIRIIGDGRLAAIDMRFINPSAPSDPGSKLNRMIDDVIAAFKETAELEYHDKAGKLEPAKGATMMVFSDLGFGADVAANRGFNARRWFEQRLREAGVPLDQVAFMSDYKKSTEKLRLFKDMNTGRKRLLIGSSKNMGTGVNAQQRLHTMFHLDSPWFPADLEQREGRIVRQGNKNKLVHLKAYAAKGTYDEQMWKLLASKQQFIDQAMSGDENLREIEDLDSVSQLEQAAALVAEDPRVMQLAGARADVLKLLRLQQAHEEQRMGYRSQFNRAGSEVEFAQSRLERAEAEAAKVVDLSGDNFRAKAGSKVYDERVKWGEMIAGIARALAAKMEPSQTIGQISGFDVRLVSNTTPGEPYTWHVQLDTPDPVLLLDSGAESTIGMAMRAQNAVANVLRLPAALRDMIAQARAQQDAVRERLQTPFPMAAMLADKVREVQALERELEDRPWRVERDDMGGQGYTVQANSRDKAIEAAVAKYGGEPGAWLAVELKDAPQPEATAVAEPGAQFGNGQGDLFADQQFERQLDLFLDSKPDPSQAGPRTQAVRGAAAQALRVLRRTGTLLGRALSSGLAENQRATLVGQVAETPEDLATLAQVYRDPRFETFRVLFTGPDGKIVSQLGLTNRLPGSTAAIIGEDHKTYFTKLGMAAKLSGATGFYMLHNHPSGQASPSFADEQITRTYAGFLSRTGPKLDFKGHVVIDTNQFSVIDGSGKWSLKHKDFGAIEPYANGGDYGGVQITSPAAAAEFSKRLQVDGDAVTLIMLTSRLRISGVTSIPAAVFRPPAGAMSPAKRRALLQRAKAQMRRAVLEGMGARVIAVSRDRAALDIISASRSVDDSIHVADDGTTTSLANQGAPSGSVYPAERRPRVTAATTPDFEYLRRDAFSDPATKRAMAMGRKVAEPGRQTDTPEFKRWFGDSKVVDAQGRPLVVYHGTGSDVGAFSSAAPTATDKGGWGRGFYFAADPGYAAVYARKGAAPNVMPVYVSLRNPIVVAADGEWGARANAIKALGLDVPRGDPRAEWAAEFTEAAQAKGHDGVIYTIGGKPAEVVAFRPEQIKSAVGNNGQFDPADPSIVREDAATFGPGAAPAEQPKTAAQRADEIIAKVSRTPTPIDAAARLLTRVTGINRLAAFAYDRGGRLLDWITPEKVKAGVTSDYGVPEAVIDERAAMQGRQRRQLREAGALVEKLSTLTRAESRVAYEWMNMDGSDPRAYLSMMQGLPEESVKVLQEVQQLIESLSKEAVRLGQLEPEAYERHRMAYLRRSYAKHTAELTGAEKARRGRAISILGDQYRGRGMVQAVAMDRIKQVAPEWWQRKLQDGKADTSLKGQKFERLERRAPSGERTGALPGIDGRKPQGKVIEVHWWPAGQKRPAQYADWDSAGTWEVRDTKGGNLLMWRDFTPEERERMGEIDEARFAIARTLHGMIHDVEVGRYLEWLAQKHAKADGDAIDGQLVEASESMRDVFAPGTWVKVPESKIPGTSVSKYGKLAGQYLPGPIWNDLRQTVNGRFKPFGEVYDQVLRAWKISKTALSPAVHTNNVMSNLVMADWHGVTAGHVVKALGLVMAASDRKGLGALGIRDREAAREVLNRYEDAGGAIGGWVTQEIRDEQMAPIIEALRRELQKTDQGQAQIGVYAAMQHLLHKRFPEAVEALRGSSTGTKTAGAAKVLMDLYQAEDDVFRLAAWLKAKEQGATDLEAGKVARRSFLDYSINAPWISAMRSTAFPFIAFTYRAVPMLLETAGKHPEKLLKLMALAGGLNALGVMLGGGGDDEERKLLPEEKAGRIWGMVPKLIRMPWNDAHGSPVYLDIRRWIPVGDVVDVSAGHAAVPLLPAMYPGGPLVVFGELVANKSMFTGKPIVLETDTAGEKAGKVLDYLWKAFSPNLVGVPGTYATQGVADSITGRTDKFGREMSTAQALASSVGVKLGSYPADVLRNNLMARQRAEIAEIDRVVGELKRRRQTNRIDADDFEREMLAQRQKKQKLRTELAEKMN